MGEIYWIGEAEKYIERRVTDNWEPNYDFFMKKGERVVIQRKEGLYDFRRKIFVRLPFYDVLQSARTLRVKLDDFFENKINELMLWNLTKTIERAVDIREAGTGFRDLPFEELLRDETDSYGRRMIAVRLEMDNKKFDDFYEGRMEIGDLEERYLKVL